MGGRWPPAPRRRPRPTSPQRAGEGGGGARAFGAGAGARARPARGRVGGRREAGARERGPRPRRARPASSPRSARDACKRRPHRGPGLIRDGDGVGSPDPASHASSLRRPLEGLLGTRPPLHSFHPQTPAAAPTPLCSTRPRSAGAPRPAVERDAALTPGPSDAHAATSSAPPAPLGPGDVARADAPPCRADRGLPVRLPYAA